MRPDSEDELAAMIHSATGPLSITGGATRLHPGEGQGARIDMRGLSGITLYEPEALTLVVRAGTTLAEVQAALAAEQQMLAFEPDPRDGSTIGGVVAANASGPRRVSAGACRDAMLGIRMVTGGGEIIANGGRVMKNVTGYDLVKLAAGSRGTLGAITEVALKTAPVPPVRATLRLSGLDDAGAIAAMTTALTGPFDVTGAGRLTDGTVILRLEGLAGSVEYRAERLRTALGPQAGIDTVEGDADFAALRDDGAWNAAALWRIVLRPSQAAPLLARLPGAHIVDWGGALIRAEAPPDWRPDLPPGARALRERGAPALLPAPDPVVARLNAGIRAGFDPRGLLQVAA
ncbi:glycolate oxidase FAD binding subunit [Paracoccus isoporae]|uniref:Glycolate oxidase FAD binding subunit n=1 Tax=Paracoccus isoporae TaxID=591205 RepID=A0A1G6XXX0_9RHOB|nr:FAD-binding protein [Paracoccus isoporae]SDD82245.1 glycolate oxidase FAD binding subunit [Paracoccus isoporae]